ncbi:hypothetical protein [Burkholderia sp. TSV86]|uniref:hypothetical protein n=1 Tax=Burkholderia sp. TSV86 TaxID=1385594 RepID=UPI000B0C8352|nr:hypothetical protein [Burkholderia sp. TSV86]
MHLNTKLSAFAILAGFVSTSVLAAPLAESVEPARAVHSVETQARGQWFKQITHTASSGFGCFRASYPNLAWEKVTCGQGPSFKSTLPSPLQTTLNASGASPMAVDNTNGYALVSSTPISSVIGTFPSVTGVTSITDPSHPSVANQYSIQLLTNTAVTSACNNGATNCRAFQRFVYSTTLPNSAPAAAFLYGESWLMNYGNFGPCPSNWSDDGKGNCYIRDIFYDAPAVPATGLGSAQTNVIASSSNGFSFYFLYGGYAYLITSPDRLNIIPFWKQVAFNVFGRADGNASGIAQFNPGSSVKLQLTKNSSTTNPTCVRQSIGPFSIAGNNLNLGSCTTAANQIQFSESN